MYSWKCGIVLSAVVITLIPMGAIAGIGGNYSTAEIATPGTLSLFCIPDGSGNVFADAFIQGGSGGATLGADATITLTVRDYSEAVVPGYPAEDIWLQWVDESALFVCSGGTIPDSDTDANGVTVWNSALRLGGYAETLVQVRVNGDALTDSAGFPLHVNSPDINADGLVNLADVGIFSRDFVDPVVRYRSDFSSDRVMNVADVGKMAQGVGASCP